METVYGQFSSIVFFGLFMVPIELLENIFVISQGFGTCKAVTIKFTCHNAVLFGKLGKLLRLNAVLFSPGPYYQSCQIP